MKKIVQTTLGSAEYPMVSGNDPISQAEIPTQDNSVLAFAHNSHEEEEISIHPSPGARPGDCFNDQYGVEGLCSTSYQGNTSLIIQK